ncbi:hypothetical protein FBU30_009530 [Linnemannia zychae]|nr:hypothetical protein FBU30_009530 [Linnemannia zychae]
MLLFPSAMESGTSDNSADSSNYVNSAFCSTSSCSITANNDNTNNINNDPRIKNAHVVAQFSSTVANLIHQNPGLLHVVLTDQPCISSIRLWGSLADSPKLSSLQLKNCTIHPNDVRAFWSACSKVETLHLLQLKMPMGGDYLPPIKIPRNKPGSLLSTEAEVDEVSTTLATTEISSPTSAFSNRLPVQSPAKTLSSASSPISSVTSTSPLSTRSNYISKNDDHSALFSRLQILKLNDFYDGFRIITQAPLIRSWEWTLGSKPFPGDELTFVLSRLKPFSFFRDLDVHICELTDTHLEELLERMTDGRDLNLNWTGFGPRAFQMVMIRHTMTLRSVHVISTQLKSKHIQTLLTSCPGLEEFSADVILGLELVRYGAPTKDDVLHGEVDFSVPDYEYDLTVGGYLGSGTGTLVADDWICLGLKSLVLNFLLGGNGLFIRDKDCPVSRAALAKQHELEQEHTFRQLSRLTMLENLQMLNAGTGKPFQHGVNLNLRARGGRLEDLATLTRLKTINFAGTKQSLELAELEWMWAHWPRLYFVFGVLNCQCSKVNATLVSTLREWQYERRTSWGFIHE